MEFVWDQENVLWQSTSSNRFITDTLSRNSSFFESKSYRWKPRAEEYRETCCEMVKNKLEGQYQCRASQEDHQPWILSFQQKYHRILWLISKYCKPRSFILTNSPHLRRFHVAHFPSFEILDAKLHLLWTRSSRIPTSWKRSVWRNRKLRKRTSFYEGDRSLTWSTTTFETLVLMIQFLITCRFIHNYSSQRWCSGIWYENGMKFSYVWLRSHLMTSRKVCTNWENVSLINSKPCEISTTWKFIRRYRGLIISSWKRWWKRYRSETSITKFRRQKWENCNRCSGYESQGIKWYWKGTRSLLSMESRRAVLERRQVQFRARQWWACKITPENHSILWLTNTKR